MTRRQRKEHATQGPLQVTVQIVGFRHFGRSTWVFAAVPTPWQALRCDCLLSPGTGRRRLKTVDQVLVHGLPGMKLYDIYELARAIAAVLETQLREEINPIKSAVIMAAEE